MLYNLYPYYFQQKKDIKLPSVQRQSNLTDCCIYAIVVAVSPYFKIKPDEISCNVDLICPHLLRMVQQDNIEHFPCNSKQCLPLMHSNMYRNKNINNFYLDTNHIDFFNAFLRCSYLNPLILLFLQRPERIAEISKTDQ